jgi:CHAP domain
MRKPGRALTAGLVLTLTACGSGPETAALRTSHAPRGAVASRADQSVGYGADVLASFTDPCAILPNDCGGQVAMATALDVDFAEVLGEATARSGESYVQAEYGDLPQPSWWSGECNANRSRGAFPLGGSFRGVPACGPQPGKSDGRLVRFFPGAWGEYEWQCTELSYRFMFLAYGVVPYNGNGDQVVDNYRPEYGGNLAKVSNNGSGQLPSPGDVLSFVSVHTAIVTGVTVDDQGNGTVEILEQNAPGDGRATLAVTKGKIARVKNWLHHRTG